MVTTTPETITEKERRYGIGYRPISRVSSETKRLTDESIFTPEKEEIVIERRISVPKHTEKAPTAKVEPKNEVATITSLSIKSKALLGLYVGIAFVLSIIVAITGIIIGNTQKEVGAVESQVKTMSTIVRVQEAQLDELSSDSYIEQSAQANGMVDTSVDGTVTLVPTYENESYSSSTNVFDAFCDWFSGVIGG
ncbi:MAG: hypothetical protein E7353_07000 [Clostridiales bacterium]|nr:hypothetical protein [Clostridiales bacterium]